MAPPHEPSAASKRAAEHGPGAVFCLIAEFLELCQFKSAAAAIRAQQEPALGESGAQQGLSLGTDFLSSFRSFVESASLLLFELGSSSGEPRQKNEEEAALDRLISGLLQELTRTGQGLSDEQLQSSLEGVLNGDGFAKFTCMPGAVDMQVPEPAAQPPEAGAPSRPSAHYVPRHEEDDEYHDDDDPGYRIREIYEAELLAELSHKMAASSGPLTRAEQGVPPRPACRAAARRLYAPSGDGFYPVELDGVVYDSFNLRVVFERDKTGFEESKEFVINTNAVVAARYQIVEYLGSAAFSRAVQCLDLETNRMVCMKIIKNDKDFFDQSLDEIKLLKFINVNGDVDKHGVLRLYDYFYHKEHLIIVTELLRDNLYEFSKFNRECGEAPYFTLGRIQRITAQVLAALEYVHSLRLIHCDLKPENILIKSYSCCEVKVIDFGSSCFVDDHLSSYVQSRSYRAPEVMLGLPYDQKIDLWSLGCIIAELWTGYVLFQNDSVQSLLARVLGIIGPIPSHIMMRGRHVPQYFTQDGQLYQEIDGPSCPERGRRLHLLVPKKTSLRQRMRSDCEEFLDFLDHLLQLDATRRPTAGEALRHPFITRCRFPDGL